MLRTPGDLEGRVIADCQTAIASVCGCDAKEQNNYKELPLAAPLITAAVQACGRNLSQTEASTTLLHAWSYRVQLHSSRTS